VVKSLNTMKFVPGPINYRDKEVPFHDKLSKGKHGQFCMYDFDCVILDFNISKLQ